MKKYFLFIVLSFTTLNVAGCAYYNQKVINFVNAVEEGTSRSWRVDEESSNQAMRNLAIAFKYNLGDQEISNALLGLRKEDFSGTYACLMSTMIVYYNSLIAVQALLNKGIQKENLVDMYNVATAQNNQLILNFLKN